MKKINKCYISFLLKMVVVLIVFGCSEDNHSFYSIEKKKNDISVLSFNGDGLKEKLVLFKMHNELK